MIGLPLIAENLHAHAQIVRQTNRQRDRYHEANSRFLQFCEYDYKPVS